MAPSSGQISFSYGATEVVISAPDAGYETEIAMPFDFSELDTGQHAVRDYGTKYDKRSCKCSFILTAAMTAALNTLLNTTARGQNLILAVPTGSGFHPFGPDKGDDGPWTVSVRHEGTPQIQSSPFNYFKVSLMIRNVGAYPAYALPAEVAEGVLTIGTVSNLRMPPNLFNPEQVYNISVDFTENSSARYVDRGALGDYAGTKFELACNEGKAAALLAYLTGAARSSAFNITTAANFYAYGINHGSNDTYSSKLADKTIRVKHNTYNSFSIGLQLKKMPGYTLTYDGNGNDSGTPPVDSNSYSPGSSAIAASPGDLAKSGGYYFVHWNEQADGGGAYYNEGASVTMSSDKVLYAIWGLP